MHAVHLGMEWDTTAGPSTHPSEACAGQAVERDQGAVLLSSSVAQCSRVRYVSGLLPWGSAVVAGLKSQAGVGRRALWPALTAIFDRCACSVACAKVRSEAVQAQRG